ncbi:hypothetical protein BBI01_13675 [Chryseobacterium artocarpi]|uniref:Carboxypeptidase-like regulatory domain-containing protein n=1 Tax=Chryseobacterium artocarpi TaxID=1414727 RepID=A0A1B8ZH73_9FLAO|nr:hypothetical protein [Chryseobacterium artocarpi]OCA70970.1 hypothetical protein BBI01_13675 [Chryseobacterium artocarpi]
MTKKFQIKEPCKQNWEEMQNVSDGKFCEVCTKKIWDLDRFSEKEIDEILEKEKSICGKISFLKPALSSVMLALTLTSATYIQAQTNIPGVENTYQKNITISGKLISRNNLKLNSGEISLVTLGKLYTAKADEEGNFTLTFPEKVLVKQNIIRIDYSVMGSNNKEFIDYTTSILQPNELLSKQNFEIEKQYTTIGAISLTDPQPPDYYFFDGKKVGKRKFERIRKEHPEYKYLAFYDKVTAKELSGKGFIKNLYLLYSR